MRNIFTLVADWWRGALARWSRRHDTSGTDAAPLAVNSVTGPGLPGRPEVAALSKAKARRKETLAKLLEEIEETFTAVRLPVDLTWLEHDTRVALRRIGPHIASEENMWLIDEEKPSIDPTIVLPSIMCVSFAGKPKETDADLVFAVKLRKSPFNVEPHQGPVYEVGTAWRVNKKHIWGKWYVGVNTKTGALRALRQRWCRRVEVPNGSYMQPVYKVPPWYGEKMNEKSDLWCAHHLAMVLTWWNLMERHWKVSVRKGKDRVTWCVPFNETKHYFADRDKTVVTPSGRAAKILHHVRAHERVRTKGVREHVRGLRRFNWKGYECAITAPKFHNFDIQMFDVSAEELAEPNLPDMIQLSHGARIIADAEDRQSA